MGWTYYYKNWKTIQEFFEKQFRTDSENIKFTVLDSSLVNRQEAYAAIKYQDIESNKEYVFAATYLVRFNRGYYNFGYKDMDESCGPGMYNCPERIMKLLTPTESNYAIEWRKKMWEIINKRKYLAKTLKIGTYFYIKIDNKKILHMVTDRNINYIFIREVIENTKYNTNLLGELYKLKIKSLHNYDIEYIEAKDLEMKIKDLK
jgi:hypothetical protein